jgi:5-methylcytosine-specific restriction protein A
MGLTREYARHSAKVTKSRRWKAVRLETLRRDGWACLRCGERRGLEIDHVLPVRTHPALAFDIGNLQTLCGPCHSRKTKIEVGLPGLPPDRAAWRDLLDMKGQNSA